MRKATLSLFVLLIAFTIHSFGQTPQWKVIKEWHVIGGTKSFYKNLFTPQTNGLYRVSVVLSATTTSYPQDGGWSFGVFWTDRSGAGGDSVATVSFESCCVWDAAPTIMFSPKVGEPVSFQLQPYNTGPVDATYDVAFTIEQLTN